MRQLRLSAIILIAGLTIFFNLERLDVGQENIINLSTFVYVIGALATISIIALPFLWRSELYIALALWVGIYVVSKLLIFNEEPLLGGINTYLTITELVLLSILIWLTHIVARSIHEFEEAVEKITLPRVSRHVRSLEEGGEAIQLEIIRSRRHNRPLSVVVVEPEEESIQITLHRIVHEVQQSMMVRYVITSLARVLSSVLRRTDLMLEQQEQNRFILLCPETDAAGVQVVVDRIQAAAANQLGITVRCGTASFPEQQLTFEQLVEHAKARLHSPAEPAEQ